MNFNFKNKLFVILGPTASGKTRLAVAFAERIRGEIISADSRQVYRGMDIGTGKDLEEYRTIRHHLIDIVEAGADYNVAFFQRDFQKAFDEVVSTEKSPILCGGTGMYLDAILRNHEFTQVPVNQGFRHNLECKSDAELNILFQGKYQNVHKEADVSTRKRLIRAIEVAQYLLENGNNRSNFQRFDKQNSVIFGINLPAEIRRERISKRLIFRLENGMIEEVEGLLKKGVSVEKLIFYGLEYKFVTQYLTGALSYEEMVLKLEIAINQFAKRQMTFFRSMERKGLAINWLDGEKDAFDLVGEILFFLENEKF